MARKPSHLGSNRKLSSTGKLSASLANMGSIGGSIGNDIDAMLSFWFRDYHAQPNADAINVGHPATGPYLGEVSLRSCRNSNPTLKRLGSRRGDSERRQRGIPNIGRRCTRNIHHHRQERVIAVDAGQVNDAFVAESRLCPLIRGVGDALVRAELATKVVDDLLVVRQFPRLPT